MADEWEDLTLGDLGRVVTGKTPLTSVEGNFGGRIPFVTPSDMDGRKTISTTARFLTQAGAASVKGSVIPAGAIMVSCIGSDMGKVVVAGCECVTNQQINSIVVDDRFSSEFVYYSLSTRKDEIRHQAAGGSAVPILNKGNFSQMEITLPPLAEQKAIAAVLGALDDKIELNRRMNATLEAMARALFQSWFVDFDPVRAKLDGRPPAALDPATAALFPEHLEDSPLSHIPKGWKCGTIGELAARILDKVDDPADWASEPLIDLSRMPQRSVALCDWGLGAELTTSVTRFLPRDVLFGAIRPYFHKVGIAPVTGVTNVSVFVVRARKSFDWAFLAALCSLDSTVEFATRVSKGTKMPVVGWPDFSNYSVVVPPAELQRKFADAVAPLYEGIIANIHQSRTLATLRDTLLPKLLSGELSVGDTTLNTGANL